MPDISIAEQAARWFARLAAHDCSDAERAAFERWRAEEGRAAAYAEVERVAALLDDALASSDRLRAMAADALQLDASLDVGDDHPDQRGDRDDGDCPAVKAGGT
jgi:ferric-dicitrate binding protein FerR (iron transport regulator)